jgi:hypothetical protein
MKLEVEVLVGRKSCSQSTTEHAQERLRAGPGLNARLTPVHCTATSPPSFHQPRPTRRPRCRPRISTRFVSATYGRARSCRPARPSRAALRRESDAVDQMLSAGTASSGIVVRRTYLMRNKKSSIIRVTVYSLALDSHVEGRALHLVRICGVGRKRRLIRTATVRASHRASQQRSDRDLGRRRRQ